MAADYIRLGRRTVLSNLSVYATTAWLIQRCAPSAVAAVVVGRENECWKSTRRFSP